MKLTEKQAEKLGYRILKGNYAGANDDVAGRWYIDNLNTDVIDKRGMGFKTKKEALETLTERIGQS